LAFTAEKPDPTTPEGALAERNANRQIGERWNAENRKRAGQEVLVPQTDAVENARSPEYDKDDEINPDGSIGHGKPNSADGRSRRKFADGILGDLIRNRSFGEDWNQRLREMHGQPKLPQ
jgi:hypothetical protein